MFSKARYFYIGLFSSPDMAELVDAKAKSKVEEPEGIKLSTLDSTNI